ncbi:MAG: carbohydrate kinase [Paracoccaceae bacterium]
MSHAPIIAIGGENLIDRVQSNAPDGTLTVVNNPGGSPFNVAVALSRQEGQAHYLTPISTDDMGDLLANRLSEADVLIAAPRRDEPTTLAIVTLQDGIPTYDFKRDGTAERCITKTGLAAAMADATAAFHVGSLALIDGDDAAEWEAFFHDAKQNGIFTSLDPNVRASLIKDGAAYRERLFRMFKTADLIKLSDEDLEWIYPDLSLEEAYEKLDSVAEAGLVVLTKGADGAKAKNAEHHVQITAPKVNDLKDTIGAGDTFMGTLLATLAAQGALQSGALSAMDEQALSSLLGRAAKAAALNCEQEGCNPPTLSALDAALI